MDMEITDLFVYKQGVPESNESEFKMFVYRLENFPQRCIQSKSVAFLSLDSLICEVNVCSHTVNKVSSSSTVLWM